MNVSDTISLIEALYATGVTHFKSHDFEVSFAPETKTLPAVKPDLAPQSPIEPVVEAQVVPEGEAFNPEATKRAQDLIDLLKRKDEDLLNVIMPDGAI